MKGKYRLYSGLIGLKVNDVEVLKIHSSLRINPQFLVKCSCGFEFICDTRRLFINRNSCFYCIRKDSRYYPDKIREVPVFPIRGANKIQRYKVGEKKGRFTVLEYRGSDFKPCYLVKCTCGKTVQRTHANLSDKSGCMACLKAENRQIKLGLPVIV